MITTLGQRATGACPLPALAFAAAAFAGLVGLGTAPAAAQQRGPQSVAPVAEKLIDAVVNISTSQIAKGPEGVPLPQVPKGSPFEDFFEDFFNKKGGRMPPSREVYFPACRTSSARRAGCNTMSRTLRPSRA